MIRDTLKIKFFNSIKSVGYAVVEERMKKEGGLESEVGWAG